MAITKEWTFSFEKSKLYNLVKNNNDYNNDKYYTRKLLIEQLAKCYAANKNFVPEHFPVEEGCWSENGQPLLIEDVQQKITPRNIPYWYWTYYEDDIVKRASELQLVVKKRKRGESQLRICNNNNNNNNNKYKKKTKHNV